VKEIVYEDADTEVPNTLEIRVKYDLNLVKISKGFSWKKRSNRL